MTLLSSVELLYSSSKMTLCCFLGVKLLWNNRSCINRNILVLMCLICVCWSDAGGWSKASGGGFIQTHSDGVGGASAPDPWAGRAQISARISSRRCYHTAARATNHSPLQSDRASEHALFCKRCMCFETVLCVFVPHLSWLLVVVDRLCWIDASLHALRSYPPLPSLSSSSRIRGDRH